MDFRGKRIIVFGDSLSHHGHDAAPEIWDVDQGSQRISGQPGDLLASMLAENGAEAVRVNARVSRSASNFFGREASQALLSADASFRPNLVFIVLGTNDIGLNMTSDAQAFESLKAQYEGMGAEVWAIGPFTYNDESLNARANEVVSMMRGVFGVRFIDGRPLSTQIGRAGDGVHFSATSAASTAGMMFSAIQNAIAFPGGKLGMVGVGIAAMFLGFAAFKWWRKRQAPQLEGVADDGEQLVKRWWNDELEGLDDVGTPVRDFSKAEAEKEFKRLIKEPDVESMEIAQDLALEHGLKLSEITRGARQDSGTFRLTDGNPAFVEKNVSVSWRARPGSNAFGRCTGEFNVNLYGKRVGGPAQDLRVGGESRRFENHYQAGEEACRRFVVADAWAIAKKMKDVQVAYGDSPSTVKYHYAERAIRDALDRDNSEPEELFGLNGKQSTGAPTPRRRAPGSYTVTSDIGTWTDRTYEEAIEIAERQHQQGRNPVIDFVVTELDGLGSDDYRLKPKQPMSRYRELMEESDPASMEIIEDMAMEDGFKLTNVGGDRTQHGSFELGPREPLQEPDNPQSLPMSWVGWSAPQFVIRDLKKIKGRWQVIAADGTAIRTPTVNADGAGYQYKRDAQEAMDKIGSEYSETTDLDRPVTRSYDLNVMWHRWNGSDGKARGFSVNEYDLPALKRSHYGTWQQARSAAARDAWTVTKALKALQARDPNADATAVWVTIQEALASSDRAPADLFGLGKKGLRGVKSKMAVGTLVHRPDKPDELYRVTSSLAPGVFRLLPYQRQGQEVVIYGRGTQWDDGITQWLIQDVEYEPKKPKKPAKKTLEQRRADEEARNAETSPAVRELFRRKELKGNMLNIWRKKTNAFDPTYVDWEHVRDTTPENADQWLARFQKDEPNAVFVVSERKPKGKKGRKIMTGRGMTE